MLEKMRAVVVDAPNDIKVTNVPVPKIKEYECLVKITATGFCNSTDMKHIDGSIGPLDNFKKIVLGHEGVGIVVKVGSKVCKFKIGDQVVGCWGRVGQNQDEIHTNICGSMVEYCVIQDHEVMKDIPGLTRRDYIMSGPEVIPQDMSPVDATNLLSIKENYSAITNFRFQPGQDVLVYGDGPVGFGIVSLLKIRGAKTVVAAGHRDERLKRIKDIAKADIIINTNNQSVADVVGDMKFDLVIDAVGSVPIVQVAAKLVKPCGIVGIYGVLRKREAEIDLYSVPNNVCIHIQCYPYGESAAHDDVMQLIEEGKINLKDYYSHAIPMDDIVKAVELVKTREAFKVILIP